MNINEKTKVQKVCEIENEVNCVFGSLLSGQSKELKFV